MNWRRTAARSAPLHCRKQGDRVRLPLLLLVLGGTLGLASEASGQPIAGSFGGGSELCRPQLDAPQPSDGVPAGLSASDWSRIRQLTRHGVHPDPVGYRARNPGQRWQIAFDGHGFTTEPDAGTWTWGLQLLRYGFATQEREVAGPAPIRVEGQRVSYDWSDTLQEWYVNDSRGLEHGYTVHTRPADPILGEAIGPLIFTLSVRGELQPDVADGGRDVRFLDESGAVVLTYSGLTVVDADGQVLPAYLERVADGLRLAVDERGARYPLTIDPVAQESYLKGSNTEEDDNFGYSVAVSGNTVVVSANLEASSATGVNGIQDDNSVSWAGAVFVFVREGTNWTQQAYLKASTTEADDLFGYSVAISGNTLVVGSIGEDSVATGVNGDESDNSASNSGAAYVFKRVGSNWSQEAYLKASNTDDGDEFGRAVSVSGDTVVVGTLLEDSNATGVDGNESNNSADDSGAAYVFVRSGTLWSQTAYLKASNTAGGDRFGRSVSVSGDTVVVGAFGEDSNATGAGGDQGSNDASDSGAVYVFLRSGGTWSQQAYLKASNTGTDDNFGRAVSVSGDLLVVGARNEDSAATGVNGNQDDNSATNSGAAYVFVREGSSWSQQAYLKASNTGSGDEFSRSLAASGDTVVIGALLEDSSATGVNGDGSDNTADDSGAAYVFVRNGTTWSQKAYLKASNTEAGDWFGNAVAIADDTVLVGAYLEDSNATGTNGDQGNNSASAAGAAYIFNIDPWEDMGCALPGVSDNPVLVGSGTLAIGSNNSIVLSNAAPSAPCGLFVALSSSPIPFKGGTLKPFPLLLGPILLATSPSGTLPLPFDMPSGLPSGTTLWFQYGIQDAAAIFNVSLSNAVVGTTP